MATINDLQDEVVEEFQDFSDVFEVSEIEISVFPHMQMLIEANVVLCDSVPVIEAIPYKSEGFFLQHLQ